MASYDRTVLESMEWREPRVSAAPLVVDDWTLAFRLGCSGKTLWHVVKNQSRFGPRGLYKRFTLKKATGGVRVIHSPSRTMKAFLTQVRARILLPLTKTLGPHVAAYQVGKSTRDAVLLHLHPCPVCAPGDGPHTCSEEIVETEDGGYETRRKGQEECIACRPVPKHDCPRRGVKVHFDLQDFFGSTRRSYVRAYFEEVVGYNHYVSSLLATVMTVTLEGRQGKSHHGVPQGAPTSGDICNLVADWKIDQPLLADLVGSGWTYSRYADDLYLSHPENLSREEVDALVGRVAGTVRRAGYRLNWKKLHVQRPNRRQTHLGLVVNNKVSLPAEHLRQMRATLHNCYRNGFAVEAEKAGMESSSRFVAWLGGRVSYMEMVVPHKAARFRQLLNLAKARHGESKGTVVRFENGVQVE
jgi:hypothetical protein